MRRCVEQILDGDETFARPIESICSRRSSGIASPRRAAAAPMTEASGERNRATPRKESRAQAFRFRLDARCRDSGRAGPPGCLSGLRDDGQLLLIGQEPGERGYETSLTAPVRSPST
jgi:hypothetical protein